jgi:hypothetical protein
MFWLHFTFVWKKMRCRFVLVPNWLFQRVSKCLGDELSPNSNAWGMWPLGHVGHITYSFINMLFISTGNFDDKRRPQIVSVGTTTNSVLRMMTQINVHSLSLVWWKQSRHDVINWSIILHLELSAWHIWLIKCKQFLFVFNYRGINYIKSWIIIYKIQYIYIN